VRIYLDTCSIQRPLDSKTHIRITLEGDAILGILSLCEQGHAQLITSDALAFETEHNPNPARKEYALAALSRAKVTVALNEQIEKRARVLNGSGFDPMDALHLACAEEVKADFFCTCDDRLLKRAKEFSGFTMRVMLPIELAMEIVK
jgi:predicted nucleic acid-binding protein